MSLSRSLARLLPSTQLNAIAGVSPPPDGGRWSALKLVYLFCDHILPSLEADELRRYLRLYRRDAHQRPLQIADYRRGVLSDDHLFDSGLDEVPLLDDHFGVSTTIYYSAGQGCFVPCAHVQPLTPPSRSATVRLVLGDAHFGVLLPAPVRASATTWPKPTPHFVRFVVPAYRAAARALVGGGGPAPTLSPPPRHVLQAGGRKRSTPSKPGHVGSGGLGHLEYSTRSRRAYAVSKDKRWYLGLYADHASSEAAAQPFLSKVQHMNSDVDAAVLSALAQKAARHTCFGRIGFEAWREDSASALRELYVKWKRSKFYLGSFRAEMAARTAMDAFLSTADRDVQEAVAAAKQVGVQALQPPYRRQGAVD